MSKHSPRSVLKERYSPKFCRTHWKTTACLFHNEGAGRTDRVKISRLDFTWHRCVPGKVAIFLRIPLRTPTIL